MKKTERLTGAGPIKIGLTALAAAALALGVSMPAYAADVQIDSDDVINYQNGDESSEGWNYDQWHIASNYDSDFPLESSVTFQECSITTLAQTSQNPGVSVVQVLKGFPIAGRPSTLASNDASELRALIETISIDVAQGSVTLQIPMFGYANDGDGGHDREFTTFRTGSLGTGVHAFSGEIVNSMSWGFSNDIDTILDEMEYYTQEEGDYFEILGVGFTGSEGAVVNSISFGGNTYYFGTDSCLPANPTPPSAVETAAK